MFKKKQGIGAFVGAAAVSLTLAAPGIVLAAGEYGTDSKPQSGSQAQTGAMGSQQQAAGQDLMNLKVSELEGKTVVNDQGQQLGDIENIVKDKQTNQLHAVVSVGGFLGIGDKQVTIPVDQLSMSGEDHLVASIGASSEELQQRTAYNEENYDEIQEEMSLAEASGAAGASGTADIAAFEDLDSNRDGVISRDEAQSAGGKLANNWQDADLNSDDQVDQSEFSAFETQQQAPGDAPVTPGTPDSGMDSGAGSSMQPESDSAPMTQPGSTQ